MPAPPATQWVPSVLFLLAVLATDVWVYTDAKAHSERGTPVVFSIGTIELGTPAAWSLGCLLLWILCFPPAQFEQCRERHCSNW